MDNSMNAVDDDPGPPLEEYGAALWRLGGLALLSTAVTLLLLVFWIQDVKEDNSLLIAACGVLAPFFVFTIYRLVLLFLCFGHDITFYEEGIYISQYGKKYQFRWENIEKVYHIKVIYRARIRALPLYGRIPIFLGESHKIVHRAGGSVIIRPQYEQFHKMAKAIHMNVAMHKIPSAIETLKGGGFLDFETMRITREGIRFRDGNNSRMAWGDVGKAGIWRDKIRVSSKGLGLDGVSVPLSETANPHLFFTFVEKVTASKQQSGR